MALVVGVNCGFVTEAPVGDPDGSIGVADDKATATNDTSPATAVKVKEIGWYNPNATEEANFEVGIYTDDIGNNRPLDLLAGASLTNAKGTGSGWKPVVGLNITISPNTIYWIGVQCDNTPTTTWNDFGAIVGGDYVVKDSQSTLPDPYGVADETETGRKWAYYALWEAGAVGAAGIMTTNTGFWGPTF